MEVRLRQLCCSHSPVSTEEMSDVLVSETECFVGALTNDRKGRAYHLCEDWSPCILENMALPSSLTPKQQSVRNELDALTFNLYTGAYLMQLMADGTFSEMHFQLVDDLKVLKLDQGNGCIVEFPLSLVTRVQEAVQLGGIMYRPGPKLPNCLPPDTLHITTIYFPRHRLVFGFRNGKEGSAFKTCMEFLVKRTKCEDIVRGKKIEGPPPPLTKVEQSHLEFFKVACLLADQEIVTAVDKGDADECESCTSV